MSLDILKEKFSGKLITSQYEDKIEIKEKIIEKLEEETNNLSNQVVNLESEKNTLLQELNKARHFEEGGGTTVEDLSGNGKHGLLTNDSYGDDGGADFASGTPTWSTDTP